MTLKYRNIAPLSRQHTYALYGLNHQRNKIIAVCSILVLMFNVLVSRQFPLVKYA